MPRFGEQKLKEFSGCMFYSWLTVAQSACHAESGAFVVVSSEPSEIIKRFLADHGVEANRIVQANLSSIGVRATPTLLLIDEHGKVLNAFVGVVGPDKTEEVLKFLRNGV